jgi:hypothetical protein
MIRGAEGHNVWAGISVLQLPRIKGARFFPEKRLHYNIIP